jgi:hypothetical protein
MSMSLSVEPGCMTVGRVSFDWRVVGGNIRTECLGSTDGRIERESLRDWLRTTGLKGSGLLGDDGRPMFDEVVPGAGGTGRASATSLYEITASEDRVVAGNFPGTRKENGNP